MTTGKLISQDEKLRRLTSRVLVEVVIDQSASESEILSGLYKPINSTISLINISGLIEMYALSTPITGPGDVLQGREWLRKVLWKRMLSNHLGKMLFVALMWLTGTLDLLLYAFKQPSLLHWFNDILLIFGGLVLMGTIILMNEN